MPGMIWRGGVDSKSWWLRGKYLEARLQSTLYSLKKSHFLLSSNFCLDFAKERLILGLFGADIVRNLYFKIFYLKSHL